MLSKFLNKIDLQYGDLIIKKHIYLLILIYVLITLPMLSIFPAWLPAIAFFSVAIKLFFLKFTNRNPPKLFAVIIMLIILISVISNYKVLGKEYTGIALLFGFSAVKLLEVNKQRDAYLFMLINILLIMGSLMAMQNPLVFLGLMVGFFGNVYLQIIISQDEKLDLNWMNNIKTIVKIFLVSIPFVVLLFFFFPRINPLWGLPNQPKLTTGLSDEMTAQSISELTQSDDLAFRVKFNSERPKNSLLYWRGPVLSNFDGKTWRRNNNVRNYPSPITIDEETKVSYTMTLDGATQNWVLTLDLPGEQPNNASINSEFQTKSNKPIVEPQVFNLISYTGYTNKSISDRSRKTYTQLPDNIFPKSRQLAEKLFKESNSNPQQFIDLALNYLSTSGFIYSLSPPEGNDNIDTFLFDNKSGYCEHYASSFAFLTRSVGIPTRVVIGYLGGELNGVSDEWEVRQLDAHAWTEVYISEEKGWVRIDPTGTVSPSRISSGNIFSGVENIDQLSVQSKLKQQSAIAKKLFNILSASNAAWQNWVIGFNQDKQNALWEKLGLKKIGEYIWIIGLIIFSIIAVLVVFLLKKATKEKPDELEKAINYFLDGLTLFDIKRNIHQPLIDLCLPTKLGNLTKDAKNIVDEYNVLRYENKDDTSSKIAITSLNKEIDNFIEKARQANRHKLR